MLRTFLVAALLLSASNFAFASNLRKLGSFISITKVGSSLASQEKFVFKVCNESNCETLGSASGYTDSQIQSLNGRLQEIGAGTMALAEVGVIVMTGGVAATVGAEATVGFESIGMFTGGVMGIVIPYEAFKFIKKLNPVVQLERGDAKLSMQHGVRRLEKSRVAAIVIFESSKLSETLTRADQIQHALDLLN